MNGTEHNEKRDRLAYRLGALLYSPATNADLAAKLRCGAFGRVMSMAICLEDAIGDSALGDAEKNVKNTLQMIREDPPADCPLLFVRVRSPRHLLRVHTLLGEDAEALTGYIFPKFDMQVAPEYRRLLQEINAGRTSPLYCMPILESLAIASVEHRRESLLAIKRLLDEVRDYVLNVRVGGNDFCNLYGLRRAADQTVYDIGVVRDILTDILNVFSRDYVVSAPVWEYFGRDADGEWAVGLRRELALDRLNGFVGKTAIHPSQLPIIHESMMVKRGDYDDACRLLHWESRERGVERSADGTRMNEVKCHETWARKILMLSEAYGIKES